MYNHCQELVRYTHNDVLMIYNYKGNHTFAIIRGIEQYQFLKDGLAPVLKEINELIESRIVEVDREMVELTFMLGGDYKVKCMYLI